MPDRFIARKGYRPRRRIFLGSISSASAIRLSGNALDENSAQATSIGTLSVVGSVGTASFTLVDSASNKIQLAGTNNVNVQAGSSPVDYETTPSFTFTVSVSGVTPAISNTTFTIVVGNVAEGGGATPTYYIYGF